MLNKVKRSQCHVQSDEEGFTLLELIIVVVIIGILAIIVVPVFANQQKLSIQASMKSDVRATNLSLISYMTKNPGLTSSEIGNRARGSGVAAGSDVSPPSNLYPITISHETTTISVYGYWDNYTIRAWNETISPESSLSVAGDLDIYYKSRTGKITIGGSS